jgi:hypothetical protein
MQNEVEVIPFVGQLTGEAIREMLQARFQQDYFRIAHSLAPEMFMRHAALSSAVAIATRRERERG